MRAVLQRVLAAKVEVDRRVVGEIGPGLLVLLGVALLLLMPPVLMYLAELGISDVEGVAGAQFPFLLNAPLAGVVFGGTLVLTARAVSACTDRTNYAALIFLIGGERELARLAKK